MLTWDAGGDPPDRWQVRVTCACGHVAMYVVKEPRIAHEPCQGCGTRRPVRLRVGRILAA